MSCHAAITSLPSVLTHKYGGNETQFMNSSVVDRRSSIETSKPTVGFGLLHPISTLLHFWVQQLCCSIGNLNNLSLATAIRAQFIGVHSDRIEEEEPVPCCESCIVHPCPDVLHSRKCLGSIASHDWKPRVIPRFCVLQATRRNCLELTDMTYSFPLSF